MTVEVRSVEAAELDRWGGLGGDDVTETARSLASDAMSGPDRWLLAEQDGRPVGRLGLYEEDAGCGRGRLEHRLFGLWIEEAVTGRDAIGRALVTAAIRRLPTGLATLDLRTNPEVHRDVDIRRALLPSVGGRTFQEKVGLVRVIDERDADADDGILSFLTIDRFGTDAYARLMGRCQTATLDRNDRFYLALCGPHAWGREMLGYLDSADSAGWLVAIDAGGDAVGYVAVTPWDDPGTQTITHIGVVPEARGRGHVDRLLRAAARVAHDRGSRSILSDVDVENRPMLAAMERAGHQLGTRAWHVWHDRLEVVTTRDGTPVTLRALEHTDRAQLMALRRAPGQERYLGSMESHFEDAVEDARAEPRMWGLHAGEAVVGFVMISDGIPEERLATDEDLVGPYYLWRLLIDADQQGRGYGRAALDLVREYLLGRPGAHVLWTSCAPGEGSPQPFYLRYGFRRTGQVKWGEDLLSIDIEREDR